jgi:hypothetical protein
MSKQPVTGCSVRAADVLLLPERGETNELIAWSGNLSPDQNVESLHVTQSPAQNREGDIAGTNTCWPTCGNGGEWSSNRAFPRYAGPRLPPIDQRFHHCSSFFCAEKRVHFEKYDDSDWVKEAAGTDNLKECPSTIDSARPNGATRKNAQFAGENP